MELDSQYETLLNMTDAQAADILRKLVPIKVGRANGKTLSVLRVQIALCKAIRALDERGA